MIQVHSTAAASPAPPRQRHHHRPRRGPRSAAAIATLTLVLLASCGSDGPSALSADDLAAEAESICRRATRAIADLDSADTEDFVAESVELLETASEDLDALVPGGDAADEFGDFTSSFSRQMRQARRVANAVADGDAGGVSEALSRYAEMTAEADELAEELEADRCVGVGQAAVAPLAAASPTDTTVPTTVASDTTVPATAAPATTVIPTLPPITTAPPTTAPPATPAPTDPPTTEPPGGTADGNLIDTWAPPAGFEFQREAGDLFVEIFPSPRADPTIAPLYVRYDVGALGGPDVSTFPIMFVLEINTDFTAEHIAAYISFEGNDDGSTVESPAGYTMWSSPATTAEGFDSTMVFLDQYAITIRTEPGVDGVGLLDAFIAANFG